MKRGWVFRRVAIYYAKAAVFAVAAYGLLLAIHGQTKLSFFEWMLLMWLAFSIGYVPVFIRLIRGAQGRDQVMVDTE
ncbi:hypothetical protein [Stenotrophomonas bentonitica]|uniref:hypothetical protein n=1 Tax=Stenotrophomonas bentonitica TaxID=1450134 RepID=UPI00345EE37A